MSRYAKALLAALFCLAALGAGGADYSEPPRAVADGIAPLMLQSRGSPLLFWQEAAESDGRSRAWIVLSRLVEGEWKTARVAGPLEYRGSEPILYSAAVSASGELGLVVAASGTAFDVLLSNDGGASFARAGRVTSDSLAVGPRIFPSASGGWLVFLTQPAKIATGGFAFENTNTLVVASSLDGKTWTPPVPLVDPGEVLVNNYLPTSIPFGGGDVVVFQHQVLGDDTAPTRWWLYSKRSEDGGRTWSPARPVSDYPEPAATAGTGDDGKAVTDARFYDNQAPLLLVSGGRLRIAWQRRFSRASQVRIVASVLDAKGVLDPRESFYLSSPASSYILSDFLEDGGRPTAIYLEDKIQANEVWRRRLGSGGWTPPEALGLTALADPTRTGLTSFARAGTFSGRVYAIWQYDDQVGTRIAPTVRERIFLLEPVLHVDPPRLAIAGYSPGGRSREDRVRLSIALPPSSAGIARVAYSLARVGDEPLSGPPLPLAGKEELWRTGTKVEGAPDSVILDIPRDGAWVATMSVEDRAGNRSVAAATTYFRDRTPPDPPLFLPPDLDPSGALASNSFRLRWLPPAAPDTAGYTWIAAGPFDPTRLPASLRPAPAIRTRETAVDFGNIDNGYWMFSVAAVDGTGNVSEVSTVILRADRQVPFTSVWDIALRTDIMGRRSLSVSGRGFLDEGALSKLLVSRSRTPPYDFERVAGTGGFRIASNRLIEDVDVADIPAGSYWIGLVHPKRGIYWAPSRVVFDVTGTVKYGLEYEWKPSWSLAARPSSRFGIYDVILASAAVFFSLGILLSMRQAVSVARDAQAVRLQVLALVNGGTMPGTQRERELRRQRRRGVGLQLKFTFFIAILVLFVVMLVALFLGISMVRNQSQALARGLDDAARVLLESAAQGGRFFLDREGAVTQLGFLPNQAKAMSGAEYITITGNSQDPKVAGRDVVFATNDPDIARKIGASRLELGVSAMAPGSEALAATVAGMAEELEARAREVIAGDLARKDELSARKAALPRGAAGDEDRRSINASLDDLDRSIRDRLRAISDEAVGSIPHFDPAALSRQAESFLFFKPILEYRPADRILYRGMVRLQANTSLIVADVAERTRALVVSSAGIAALVLLVGILGAFFLSRSIVRPIGKVIGAIDVMRRTEDKAELEGFNVEVKGRDEIAVLATAANALATELVEGAKQSKALIEGADIQNHFIPLVVDRSGLKLTISRQDGPFHELFGYYKGAKRVSGDYWNFEPLGNDGKYYYFIKCDVSGKDVSAAFIMVQVGTMVINHFNEWERLRKVRDFELAKLTYEVNDFLVARKYRGKFAAFTLGVISMTDGEVVMSHAGDNMFRVWRASTGRTLSEPFQPDVDKSSPATGMIDRELLDMKGTGFYTYRRRLEKGDILLLYSDGMEDPIHRFRDAAGNVVPCTELPGLDAGGGHAEGAHAHHNQGSSDEHLGPERLDEVIEAYDRRELLRLRHDHESERDLVMSFDFRKAEGGLEERVMTYLGVGKVFSIYDWNASDEDFILLDRRIEAWLGKFFDQFGTVFRKRRTIEVKTGRKLPDGTEESIEDPNYVMYLGIREDEQYDDLSIAAIRRK